MYSGGRTVVALNMSSILTRDPIDSRSRRSNIEVRRKVGVALPLRYRRHRSRLSREVSVPRPSRAGGRVTRGDDAVSYQLATSAARTRRKSGPAAAGHGGHGVGRQRVSALYAAAAATSAPAHLARDIAYPLESIPLRSPRLCLSRSRTLAEASSPVQGLSPCPSSAPETAHCISGDARSLQRHGRRTRYRLPFSAAHIPPEERNNWPHRRDATPVFHRVAKLWLAPWLKRERSVVQHQRRDCQRHLPVSRRLPHPEEGAAKKVRCPRPRLPGRTGNLQSPTFLRAPVPSRDRH